MQMPFVDVAGKLDRDGVVDGNGDLGGRADDRDVLRGHRQVVLARLRQDRAADAVVVMRACRMRLIDDGLPQLGSLHFYRDHLPCHKDSQGQKNEADQAPELTLTALPTVLAHNDLRGGRVYLLDELEEAAAARSRRCRLSVVGCRSGCNRFGLTASNFRIARPQNHARSSDYELARKHAPAPAVERISAVVAEDEVTVGGD